MELSIELKFLLIVWGIIFSVIFLGVLRIKKILTNTMIYKWIFIIFLVLIYYITSIILKFGFEIQNLVLLIPLIIPIVFYWLTKFKIINFTIASFIFFVLVFGWKFLYNNFYVDNYNQPYIKVIEQLKNINNLIEKDINDLKINCNNILWNCDIIDEYLEESQKIKEAYNTSDKEIERLNEYCKRVSIWCKKISYINGVKKYKNTEGGLFLHTKQQELNYLIIELEMKLIRIY
jgi:hypothetical protein